MSTRIKQRQQQLLDQWEGDLLNRLSPHSPETVNTTCPQCSKLWTVHEIEVQICGYCDYPTKPYNPTYDREIDDDTQD